jgi:glycosyltransferase involved in cell wall biosynthesis
MIKSTVYVNGKFTAQESTGVQRVATQLLLALDKLLAGTDKCWILVCPPGARALTFQHIQVLTIPAPWGSLVLWEQWALRRVARDGLLLSLAGSAPYFARRQIATIHDAAVFDRPEGYTTLFALWYRSLFRRLARHAELLLTVSEFSRQRLMARLGVAENGILVLHNGSDHLQQVRADPSALARLGLLDRPYLLAVGVANRSKNIEALLAAFTRLQGDRGPCLVLVGGRNDRVFGNAAAAADPPGVVRTGLIDDPSLKALYQHAIALVFPSLYEGFGLPPLEAMECDCPVAVATTPAALEVCGEAALHFNPQSADEMTIALEKLVNDGQLRARLRAAGREHASKFRWSRAAALLLSRMRNAP